MAQRNSVFNPKSRYVQGGDTEVYENRLGWWERDLDSLTEDDTDDFIVIANRYDRRPDKFAADYFGNATMMWVLLQFNHFVDINEEFVAGKRIRVPIPDRAIFDFLSQSTGGVFPKTQTQR